jgi:hypothetical protein
MHRYGKVFAVVAMLAFAPPAALASLITNGGFEEIPDLNGWTVTHAASGSVISIYNNSHTGLNSVGFGAMADLYDSIDQSFSTTASAQYQLSFWLSWGSAGPSNADFQALWNGSVILDVPGASTSDWTQYSFLVLATSGSTNLKFQGYNNPTWYYLDDVSVDPAGIPEPSTLLLGGAGLLGLALLRRR